MSIKVTIVNMFRTILVFSISCLALASCAQTKQVPAVDASIPIAFPGAEGYGKYATGGRGGKVVVVQNLEDAGKGSFRDALKIKGPKIIVFAVSGTIHLQSKLNIPANTTVAGQSAPGGGICLADYPVSITGDNVIVRFLRFRMGDRFQNAGMVPGSGSDDAFGAQGRKNLIIDHCSMSWSTDEVFSVYNGDSVTLQWNFIAEPLNYSYHFEAGDKDFEHHGYGGIWGGRHMSAHHNLFAHCASRSPRFNGIRQQGTELVDFRNNVLYNWGHNNVYAGEGGRYNLVNNYYRPGPETNRKVAARIVNPGRIPDKNIPFGQFYVAGNFVDGAPDVTADNRLGVHMDKGTAEDKAQALQPVPFAADPLFTEDAQAAFQSVLKNVGAVLPLRDTLDQRIINDVQQRKGKFIDVQGGYPHGTPYAATVNAWPALAQGTPPDDTDGDGIPDAWEKANGLDPADGADAASIAKGTFYANIERYLNSLVQQ